MVEDLRAKDAEINSLAFKLYNMKQQFRSHGDDINRLKKKLEKEKARTKQAKGKSARLEAFANGEDFM